MSRFLATIILISAAIGPAAGAGLEAEIAGRAITCWTNQTAMRGVRLAVDLDAGFDSDGNVETAAIAAFAPGTETGKALAQDVADALKACGPYITEGRRRMALHVEWPLSPSAKSECCEP